MAHIGRKFPIYTPSRILNPFLVGQAGSGTELVWEVESWRGLAAAGAANNTRGIFPLGYSAGDRLVQYQGPLVTWLGTPVVLTVTFTLNVPSTDLIFGWSIDWGSSNCAANLSVQLLTSMNGQVFAINDVDTHGPSYAVLSMFGTNAQFGAVPWTYTPPPPMPTPFII
jgi:hypothetical protein